MSGVHQINIGSNVVPVLCLRPPGKCPRVRPVWLPATGCSHICDVTGSQGVTSVRQARFIIPKQTNICPCEERTLHHSGIQGENGPHLSAAELSPSQILPGSQSQQGGATKSGEKGASKSPMRGKCQSGLGEGRRSGPHPGATQLSLS